MVAPGERATDGNRMAGEREGEACSGQPPQKRGHAVPGRQRAVDVEGGDDGAGVRVGRGHEPNEAIHSP